MRMARIFMIVLLLLCISLAFSDEKAGLRIRLTNKGLKYAMDTAMATLQHDLQGKSIHIPSGRSGKFRYDFISAKLVRFQVGAHQLSSIPNVGVRATVKDIYIEFTAYVKFWFWIIFKVTDHVRVMAKTGGANFNIDIGIGKTKDSKPLLSLPSCSADVGHLSLHFSHSKVSAIFNILADLFKGKIKRLLNEKICDVLRTEVNVKANAKLAKIKVQKKLDKWAIIEYGLAKAPVFTQNFMDIPIQGYFKPVSGKGGSSLKPPALPSTQESGKMLYCWLSDYLFNTAGDIYQQSGILKTHVDYEHAPKDLKQFLSTNSLKFFIPGLYRKYPNHTMNMKINSLKAPKLLMQPGDIILALHAGLDFNVQTKSGLVPVFGYNMDVFLNGKLWVAKNYLHGNVTKISVDPTLQYTYVGPIKLSDAALKLIIEQIVVQKLRGKFAFGIPLPSVDQAELINPKVEFRKGYMLISSDVKYDPSKDF